MAWAVCYGSKLVGDQVLEAGEMQTDDWAFGRCVAAVTGCFEKGVEA